MTYPADDMILSAPPQAIKQPRIFYDRYIVGVGFLSHVVCAFHLCSTLSVFLKPLTEELGVSRGLFSLLRSGEILTGAIMTPFFGFLFDATGSYVTSFVLFALIPAGLRLSHSVSSCAPKAE